MDSNHLRVRKLTNVNGQDHWNRSPTPKRHQQDQCQQHETTTMSTPTEMVVQLQSFFVSREKDLMEREMAVKKQVQLLQEEQLGKKSDVLQLHVGGSSNSTILAVLRSTLTYFEKSMLASRFCGRWDDALEKDKDGNFFINQDPKVFIPLLNYLRLCDQKKRDDIEMTPPPATAEFCAMLDYYGLLSMVYPQEWKRVGGSPRGVVMTRDEQSSDGTPTVTIFNSRTGLKTFVLQVQKDCPTSNQCQFIHSCLS